MTPLRIALLAPPWLRVPPEAYGGIEWVVAALADGLVDRGHDVTLFAAGGSSTKARLEVPLASPPYGTDRIGELFPELVHALWCYVRAGEFDVVHDHCGLAGPALGAFSQSPSVVTVHGAFVPEMRRIFELVAGRVHIVFISESQRSEVPEIPALDIIHNGIDVDEFPFVEEKDDFLLYMGRFTPEKGAHTAIEVAHRVGLPLVLTGKAAELHEKVYVQERILPNLGAHDDYRGEVTEEEKRKLYAQARCVLFPIEWREPFGLVMIEAMACGTPVVAFRRGAVPEVVDHGRTGFIVDNADEMVAAIGRASEIHPAACRGHVEAKFSAHAMVDAYERAYLRAIRAG